MPLPLCYLNGEFLPLEQARVSPLDRAFLFGDAVYEVIPVYGTRSFRLKRHLQRLDRSLEQIGMRNPLSHAQWKEICRRLIDDNAAGDAYLYLQVTRGAELGRNHAWPDDLQPTVFGFASPVSGARAREPAGISAMTAPDVRWARCDIKSTALLANVLLRKRATDAGHFEAILMDDGALCEGTSSAVHVLRGDTLCSPPLSHAILPSITREVVEELATALGLHVLAMPVSEEQLRNADEIWISLSTRGVLAVTRLDNDAVGNGAPGPMFRRMRQAFVDHLDACASSPEL